MHLHFDSPPSAAAFMLGALLPKLRPLPLSALRSTAAWRGARVTELMPRGRGVTGEWIHPVYLHAATMRLMMAMLTARRFPIPIWRVLQIRNQIVLRRAPRAGCKLDVASRLGAVRVLPKAVEFDIAVEVAEGGRCALESVTTYHARGKFDGPRGEAAFARAPDPPSDARGGFSLARNGALEFARLTGDYNGIHLAAPYARTLGFRGPLAHPHRALAEILDRLPDVELFEPFELDVWFKGPVYYDRELALSHRSERGACTFALRVDGDARPAVVGQLTRRLPPAERAWLAE